MAFGRNKINNLVLVEKSLLFLKLHRKYSVFQLGRLLAFMLSSKQEVDQRIYALSFMMGEQRGSEVLKMIISSSELVRLWLFFVSDVFL